MRYTVHGGSGIPVNLPDLIIQEIIYSVSESKILMRPLSTARITSLYPLTHFLAAQPPRCPMCSSVKDVLTLNCLKPAFQVLSSVQVTTSHSRSRASLPTSPAIITGIRIHWRYSTIHSVWPITARMMFNIPQLINVAIFRPARSN